jgi:uncharacterized membrane protein (TIGR02234 family)
MRSRALAFGCLLSGGALALIANAQPWWRATGDGLAVTFTGTQATAGLSQALAIVALAGTLLMLALRARGRRVVGALLAVLGLGIGLAGGLRVQPSADAVRSQVREVSLVEAFRLSTTAWPWIFALSGVLIVVGAAVTMITAGSWPARSNRFELDQAAPTTSDESAELWRAMDAGVDPTSDASVGNRAPPNGGGARGDVLPPQATTTAGDSQRDARAAGNGDDHDTPTVADPKMRDRGPGDTMDGTEQARQ